MTGYINSQQLGLLMEKRVEWAVEEGLLHYDGEDYCLTQRSQRDYDNFFRWVAGNCDGLIKNKNYKEPENIVVKSKTTVKGMTHSEVADLFSGL